MLPPDPPRDPIQLAAELAHLREENARLRTRLATVEPAPARAASGGMSPRRRRLVGRAIAGALLVLGFGMGVGYARRAANQAAHAWVDGVSDGRRNRADAPAGAGSPAVPAVPAVPPIPAPPAPGSATPPR